MLLMVIPHEPGHQFQGTSTSDRRRKVCSEMIGDQSSWAALDMLNRERSQRFSSRRASVAADDRVG
jgi:hypothetical protein